MSESYIEKFNTCFGDEAENNPNIIEIQKATLGFSLIIIPQATIKKSIHISIEKSRKFFDNYNNHYLLHIFGPFITLATLTLMQGGYFMLLILIFHLWIIPMFQFQKILNGKINQLLNLRFLFNTDIGGINSANKEFMTIDYTSRRQSKNVFRNYFLKSPYISFFGFLFFILVNYLVFYIFGGVPLFYLIIILIHLLCVLFDLQEKIIVRLFEYYYNTKFYFIDIFPFLFNSEFRKYDFYYDLYRAFSNGLNYLNLLNSDLEKYKSGNFTGSLNKNLKKSMKELEKIMKLLNKNSVALSHQNKFKIFLKNLLNEIIEKYSEIFNYIEEYANNNLTYSKNPVEIVSAKIVEMQREKMKHIKEELIALKI